MEYELYKKKFGEYGKSGYKGIPSGSCYRTEIGGQDYNAAEVKFLQLHKSPILIDEIKYAPELFAYIKMNVDKNHKSGDFWLTGSQIFKLMRGVQESLAGRVAVLSLTSLSQAGIAEAMGKKLEPLFINLPN